MIELFANEVEFSAIVSGVELATFTEYGPEPLLRFVGSEDEIVAMLRRCAEQVGCEITPRDPGPSPDRYTWDVDERGYHVYDGGTLLDTYTTREAAEGLVDALNEVPAGVAPTLKILHDTFVDG